MQTILLLGKLIQMEYLQQLREEFKILLAVMVGLQRKQIWEVHQA
jgi:hypothetical protein